MNALSTHGSGADGVDSDSLADELVGQSTDHTDLGGLGHGVVEQRGRTGVGDLRGGDDDGRSLAHVGNGSSGQEEGSLDVEVDGVVLRGRKVSDDELFDLIALPRADLRTARPKCR